MQLKIGDKVKVIDDSFDGEVVGFEKEKVKVLCPDDFEYTFFPHQLIKLKATGETEHLVRTFNFTETELPRKKKASIQFKGKKPTFDLHIENFEMDLLPNSPHEHLQFQLQHVREIIHKAKIARVRNLVLIHGMGKGVLREEIRNMLSDTYPNIEYFDASYTEFGQGATELIIHGLGKLLNQ